MPGKHSAKCFVYASHSLLTGEGSFYSPHFIDDEAKAKGGEAGTCFINPERSPLF